MGKIGVRQYILLAILAVMLSIVGIIVVQKTMTTSAAPGINKKINFQGKITGDDGLNVSNGTYEFVFRLYTVSSAGSHVWEETANLSVVDGIFHHALGSSTSLPGSVDFDTDNIFLGITFNSDPDGEMTPRIQLTASPYAFNSDQLDGLDASDFVQLSPSVAQTGDIDITGSISAGSGTIGGDLSVDDDLAVDTDTLFVDASNNRVGVGTDSPDVALDIVGRARISDRLQIGSTVSDGECLLQVAEVCSAGLQLEHNSTASSDPTYGITSQATINSASENDQANAGIAGGLILAGAEDYTGSNIAVQGFAIAAGTGNISRLVGVSAAVAALDNTTIDETMGINIDSQFLNGADIDTNLGIAITNPTVFGATIQDNYGLYIANQTAGTNINVGLHIGGGTSYALYVDSGTTNLNGNLVVDTNTLYVDAANNRVGIGGTPAAFNLEVTGTAKVSQGLQIGTSTSPTQCATFLGTFNCNYGLQVSSVSNGANTFNIGQTVTNVITAASSNGSFNYGNFTTLSLAGTQNYTGSNTSFSSLVSVGTTGTTTNAAGYSGTISVANGTVTNAYGLQIGAGAGGSGAAITNNYGINISSTTATGGATVGANYAVRIQNQTAGSTDYGVYIEGADTYALWVDSGVSRFDANVVLNAALPTGDTADHICRSSTGVLSTCTSASRFKQDVSDLDLGLEELNLLQPVSYTWSATGKSDIGFLAEQVAAVIPQAVTYDDNGEVISFNYNTISALLVSGVQELSVKVSDDIVPRLEMAEQSLASISFDASKYATASHVQSLVADIEGRIAVLEQGNFSNLTVRGDLTVAGALKVTSILLNGKITTSGATPAANVLGAGTGIASVEGNDAAGEIRLDAGQASANQQVRITFAVPYNTKPRISLTPTSSASGQAKYYVEPDTLGFTINFTEPPSANQTYSFSYFVVQ